MSKYIGMNEEALKIFGFSPIGEAKDGSTIWSSLFGSGLVKVMCGVVIEAL